MTTPSPRSIAFIGAGNMSYAIISGMVKKGYDPSLITASNPSTGKLDRLQEEFGINVTQNNLQAISQSDVVVLSVKPQLLEEVCKPLSVFADLSDKLMISLAAGVSCDRISDMLGKEYRLIRCMPNTPSALGKGFAGLYANQQTNPNDKVFCEWLMQHVGGTLWAQSEADIDVVIAAAGSSPAYFFLFLEAMQAHTQALGINPQDARNMVQQAMLGAAEMVCHNPELEISELRAQVTSKGGTTAKAIEYFQQQNLTDTVAGAMDAAIARAQEMAKTF